jgi:curved DNA-binding protein CbpA
MIKRDYYEIFGVYPPIDINRLQESYRQLVFEFHPDRNPDRKEWAIEKTMEIVEGYSILINPEKREVFDFQLKFNIRADIGQFIGVSKKIWQIRKTQEEINAENWFKTGIHFFESMDTWNQAQYQWLQCIKIIPGFVNAHFNLGILSGYQGKFKDALKCFETIVKISPVDLESKTLMNITMGFIYGRKASTG